MKRLLLCLLYILFLSEIKAQITFCPPGAKWNCLFGGSYPNNFNSTVNRGVVYVGDSILNGQPVKVLLCDHFFRRGNNWGQIYTLIRQSGDTVFMRNQWTYHQWQILYNYAAPVGSSWTNTFAIGSPAIGYTTTVDSVGTRLQGSASLKELKVHYSNTIGDVYTGLITERFGSNNYLFNYVCSCGNHGEAFIESLCYEDSTMEVIQFTSKSCNFSNQVGFDEQNVYGFKIYPNPANDFLNIESEEEFQITLTNLNGKISKQEDLKDQKINTSDLAPGMYFLQIWKNSELVYNGKVVKE